VVVRKDLGSDREDEKKKGEDEKKIH